MELQLQYSSFLRAKVIQKHIDTYYSSIFKYILFIFIMYSKVIKYFSNISCTCTFKIYNTLLISKSLYNSCH